MEDSNFKRLETHLLSKELVSMGYTTKELPAEIKRMRRENQNSVNALTRRW